MQFVTPGAVVMGILFATYPSVATSLGLAREQKILKRLNGTPLPAWAFLVGRARGAALLAVAAVAVMLAVGVLAYDVQSVWSTVPATIVAILLGITTLTLLGLAVGVLAPSAASAQTFAMATAVAIPFLSGLFMVGANPPAWLDAVGSLFPVRHLLTTLQDQFNPFLTGSGCTDFRPQGRPLHLVRRRDGRRDAVLPLGAEALMSMEAGAPEPTRVGQARLRVGISCSPAASTRKARAPDVDVTASRRVVPS